MTKELKKAIMNRARLRNKFLKTRNEESKGLITWRIFAMAEILSPDCQAVFIWRLYKIFSPGWDLNIYFQSGLKNKF